MTTTTTFQGMNPEGKSSSRVLQPPGGGSSFSLGLGEQTRQPVRKNRMASNIFGPPEDLPSVPHTNFPGDKTTVLDDLNQSSPRQSCSLVGNCGDSADKGEANDFVESEVDKNAQGQNEEEVPTIVPPAEPTPMLPVAVPSRRNPPGGKSSLVLG